MTLDDLIEAALFNERYLRRLARLRLRNGRRVGSLPDQIEAQQATVKALQFVARYEAPFRTTVQRVKEAEEDARVKALMMAFPDAEISDVREMESTE